MTSDTGSVFVDESYVGELLRLRLNQSYSLEQDPRGRSHDWRTNFGTEVFTRLPEVRTGQLEVVIALSLGGWTSLDAAFGEQEVNNWAISQGDTRYAFRAWTRTLDTTTTGLATIPAANVTLELESGVVSTTRFPSREGFVLPSGRPTSRGVRTRRLPNDKTNLEQGLWQAKDERLLTLGEMETRHIRNCIAKILRSNNGWRKEWLPEFYAELARRKEPIEEPLELPPIWKRELDL